MEKPKECKFCKETEFKFHENTKIYNPETNEEDDIENVYECCNCETYHFETDDYIIVQIGKLLTESKQTPKLADYMNS